MRVSKLTGRVLWPQTNTEQPDSIFVQAPVANSLVKRGFIAIGTSLWVILAAATACRVAYTWQQSRRIPAQVLATVSFEQETGNIAYALARGKGFSSPMRRDSGPTAWLTPIYPLLIAGVFRLFGVFTVKSFYVAVTLNIIFSVLTCVPVYRAGQRIAGTGTGSLAAWLWAVFPNAIIIPFQWIWDTSLAALLAATILWATLEVAESRRKRDWCSYGVLWGLALMTNPALGSVLPFLLVWAGFRLRTGLGHGTDRRGRIARPLLAAAVMVLCCVPWGLRNEAVFHRFIPLRSNFPFELWLGNNEVFDDSSRNVNARVTRFGEQRRFLQLGETAFMQEKWELATQFIRTHLRLEVRLTEWRFLKFWLGSFHPAEDFAHAESALVRIIFLVSFLTGIGAVAGAVVLWGVSRPVVTPAAAYVFAFPSLYYLTHSSLRYRHPIDPILVLLTAVAVSAGVAIPLRRVCGDSANRRRSAASDWFPRLTDEEFDS